MNRPSMDSPKPADRDFERRLKAEPETGRFAEPRSWWNRTADEVSSWFGNTDAMRRRQRDEAVGDHAGKGPNTEITADTRIVDDVSRHLTADSALDASRMEVLCSAGVVTLNGEVITAADRSHAEHLAAAVSGVTSVQNNLLVA
jgi:osmotically-inducible protein OsmY